MIPSYGGLRQFALFCFVLVFFFFFQFKVDRLQIIVVAKKYIYMSQLFISRMPKMRAIPQNYWFRLHSITALATRAQQATQDLSRIQNSR